MNFEADTDQIWIYKLSVAFDKANKLIEKTLGHEANGLKYPNFAISQMKCYRGLWIPETRTIQLSVHLLRDYEWGAVEYVLKHEMAHMIVDEIFSMSKYGVSHGEAFKKACDVLGIDSNRCSSDTYLQTFKGNGESTVVDKVRKLLIKGNCSSINKAEADLFLNKAQEIMVSHNISMLEVSGSERFFVVRPVGLSYRKIPSYLITLRNLISEFYFVKSIQSWTYDAKLGRHRRHVELFGEKENVDIAEYIYHAILSNADILWNEFSSNKKMAGEMIRGRYSKSSFIRGVISGYRDQLEARRKEVVEEPKMNSIIYLKDPLVEEMFKKTYPTLRHTSHPVARSGGYGEGRSVGQRMQISRAVSSSANYGRCLTA